MTAVSVATTGPTKTNVFLRGLVDASPAFPFTALTITIPVMPGFPFRASEHVSDMTLRHAEGVESEDWIGR